uniref:Uncharacterized protein n=1 Tax=Salix viminalis TaxID=40686 RepID=A0A6N2NJM6_SALVM
MEIGFSLFYVCSQKIQKVSSSHTTPTSSHGSSADLKWSLFYQNKSPKPINHVSRDPVSHWYCYELQEVPLHFK